jgi:hypothetical protein
MARTRVLAPLLVALAATACAGATSPPRTMGPLAADTLPAAVVQRFVDAANARNADAMAVLVAPDVVFARFPDGGVMAQGRESVRALYARMLPPLSPGFRITVEPRIVEGTFVIDKEYFTGTPAEVGEATWMYEVYGGLIRRAWAVNRSRR